MSSFEPEGESTLSPDERFHEKNEIIKILKANLQPFVFDGREWSFIERVSHAAKVSVKELFWLRDIKDKYL